MSNGHKLLEDAVTIFDGSPAKLARALGCSRQAIHYWRHARVPGWRQQQLMKIVLEYDEAGPHEE